MDLRGRRITLMGLGRHGGGVAAARYLARAGARVTISDLAGADALAESLAGLADVPLARAALGSHDEADFRNAELLVVNPAVPLGHPLLTLARENGARLTSEIELFLEACPARIIGVTGTNGKSTTAAMIAAMLERENDRQSAGRRAWLGGNIGRSLLPHLTDISADDWVVLELSSFQLAHLSAAARMPDIAVVTNCSADHLDWHGSYERYVAAKQRMVCEQGPSARAVLNFLDPEVNGWASLAGGRAVPPWALDALPDLLLPGLHNRHNAACAAAAARTAGCSDESIRGALAEFRGLEHRLELVARKSGRLFFNDSKSTTPESTRAALAAVEAPVWLLAGGQDKGVCFRGLGQSIVQKARGAAFFGRARECLRSALGAQDPAFDVFTIERMADALDWCWSRSRPGHAILLSPACASFDQFQDYQDRGRQFARLVRAL